MNELVKQELDKMELAAVEEVTKYASKKLTEKKQTEYLDAFNAWRAKNPGEYVTIKFGNIFELNVKESRIQLLD